MPSIRVDGIAYEVEAGRTILQVLDDLGLLMNGIDIPHYCWHPKLSIDGSCRLCQVEVEGIPKLQIACNTPIQDGMVIRTQCERVKQARQAVMELLLVNHPLDCPICDQAGECKLQDYAYEYGMTQSRSVEPRRALRKNVRLGPRVRFDQERCILCRRCVRFCREVPGTGELAVLARGDASVIDTFPGSELDNDYSMNVVDICPVGALTSDDFRFKIRVWFLEDVPGLCTGCAKGCNIQLGVANNKVYRYVPRRNDAVNETWMCDAGRLSYKAIGSGDRIQESAVRGADGTLEITAFERALQEAAQRLRSALEDGGVGTVAGIASAHASNEDLYTFKRFLEALGVEHSGLAVVTGEADGLLVQAEKAANGRGARAMGFAEAEAIAGRIRAGEVAALLVLGHDLLHEPSLGGLEGLAQVPSIILIDSHHSDLSRRADVLLPARCAAEKHGCFTNCDGRVQRVQPAVEPAWEAHDEGEVLSRLGRALGLAGFEESYDVRGASKALSQAEDAFSGIDLDSVGEAGRPLAIAADAAGGDA